MDREREYIEYIKYIYKSISYYSLSLALARGEKALPTGPHFPEVIGLGWLAAPAWAGW